MRTNNAKIIVTAHLIYFLSVTTKFLKSVTNEDWEEGATGLATTKGSTGSQR